MEMYFEQNKFARSSQEGMSDADWNSVEWSTIRHARGHKHRQGRLVKPKGEDLPGVPYIVANGTPQGRAIGRAIENDGQTVVNVFPRKGEACKKERFSTRSSRSKQAVVSSTSKSQRFVTLQAATDQMIDAPARPPVGIHVARKATRVASPVAKPTHRSRMFS